MERMTLWPCAKFAAFVLVPAMGLALSACSGAAAPTLIPTSTREVQPASTAQVEKPGPQSEVLANGVELYTANCQACHGDQLGQGGTGAPLHNREGHTWHHPDAQLKEWVINGKLGFSQMPGFQDQLTAADVDAVLAYIKTWWSVEQRESQADISQRYQEALNKQKKRQ